MGFLGEINIWICFLSPNHMQVNFLRKSQDQNFVHFLFFLQKKITNKPHAYEKFFVTPYGVC